MPIYGYAQTGDLANFGLPPAALALATTTVQEEMLVGASRTADSYIAKKYTLPLLAWGEDLTDAVCAIASWRLMVRVGANPQLGPDAWVLERYREAIKWLEGIASGDVESPAIVGSGSVGGGEVGSPIVLSKTPNTWSMDPDDDGI